MVHFNFSVKFEIFDFNTERKQKVLENLKIFKTFTSLKNLKFLYFNCNRNQKVLLIKRSCNFKTLRFRPSLGKAIERFYFLLLALITF